MCANANPGCSDFAVRPGSNRCSSVWRANPAVIGTGRRLLQRGAAGSAGPLIRAEFAQSHERATPQGYNRTSYFINGEDDFFALGGGDRVLLVNKRRVRDVRLDATGGRAAV